MERRIEQVGNKKRLAEALVSLGAQIMIAEISVRQTFLFDQKATSNKNYHETNYGDFPSTLVRQRYQVKYGDGVQRQVDITSGLLGVIQWPDASVECFQSFQVDQLV